MKAQIKNQQEQFYSLLKRAGIMPVQSRILAVELQGENISEIKNVNLDRVSNRFKIETDLGQFSITNQNVDLPFVDLRKDF